MSREMHTYNIPYVGLKLGIHKFSYTIEEKFFEAYTDIEEIEKAEIIVDLIFNKKSSHFELDFNIHGYIFTACDRCLNNYPQELLDEFKIFVKLTHEEELESEDPNVVFLSRNKTQLELKQLIYEFIQLSIPIQRICDTVPGKTKYCNLDTLKHINKHEATALEEEEDNNEDIDPRWSALKNIK